MIDGQGNFGSQDGDPPAAMRYTEVRMEKLAEAMLEDIEKETVDFQLNFDDSLKEPLYYQHGSRNCLAKRFKWYCRWYGY